MIPTVKELFLSTLISAVNNPDYYIDVDIAVESTKPNEGYIYFYRHGLIECVGQVNYNFKRGRALLSGIVGELGNPENSQILFVGNEQYIHPKYDKEVFVVDYHNPKLLGEFIEFLVDELSDYMSAIRAGESIMNPTNNAIHAVKEVSIKTVPVPVMTQV